MSLEFGLFCFLLFAFGMAGGMAFCWLFKAKENYGVKKKVIDEEDETPLVNVASHKSSKRRSDVTAYISKSNKVHSKRDCSGMGEHTCATLCRKCFPFDH